MFILLKTWFGISQQYWVIFPEVGVKAHTFARVEKFLEILIKLLCFCIFSGLRNWKKNKAWNVFDFFFSSGYVECGECVTDEQLPSKDFLSLKLV